MKHRLLCAVGLIMLGLVVFTSGPTEAQTVAPGPYYANPSWDQTLTCTTLATCPRFIVLSNMGSQAVLDRETGLVWEQAPDGTNTYTWERAQIHCNFLTLGGRVGWRLPNLQELLSLIDPSQSNQGKPALPAGHPFSNVQLSDYWSATTYAPSSGTSAWDVFLLGGVANIFNKDDSAIHAWCVRGGQGVDPQ